jgi:hypothetical protein
MADAHLGLGHNNPPEPTPIERAESLIPACDDWTGKGALTNEDEARDLGEFLVQIRKARQALIDERDAAKKPYEDALALIDSRFKVPVAKLEMAIERIGGSKRMTGLLADWMKREQDRLRAEAEEKRKAAEDAARDAQRASDKAAVDGGIDAAVDAEQAALAAAEAEAAARKAPVRARVRGDLAPRALHLRDYWSAVIKDWPLARKAYRKNPKVVKAYDEAVQAAADVEARQVKDVTKAPPGVEFIKREQAQ